MTTNAHLGAQLEERGYKGRVVSIQHLNSLRDEIEKQHRQGLFDQEFYDDWLTSFVFRPTDSLPDAVSLIVVAVPQPQFQIVFNWNGKRYPIRVPPTYLHGREIDRQVEDVLTEILGSAGYRVTTAQVPQKLLAVCSGLAAYGRNNITYVDGMGSFYRPVVFYSDLPCEADNWQAPKALERCQNCVACLRHCPTGAISAERFLLHAERCITLHNERPSEVPFPAWLDASWHNCLIGCFDCQQVCPENQDLLGYIEKGAEFSVDETALLIRGVQIDQLPAEMAAKLEASDLVRRLDVLPRNLKVLLNGVGRH